MSVSYPSKILTVLDVPEVRKFSATFEYNFFEKDEKSNGKGLKVVQGIVDENNENLISRKVPRLIRFSFESVDTVSNASMSDDFALKINKPKNVKRILQKNIHKIQNETSVATRGYTSINLQDSLIDDKAGRILRLAIIMRSQSATNGEKKDLPDSRSDIAKLLNSLTSKSISGNWLMRLSNNISTGSTYAYKTRDRRYIRRNRRWTRRLSNIKLYSQFNDKFLGSIIKTAVLNPSSPFTSELSRISNPARAKQNLARLQGNPGTISDYEYLPNIKPISVSPSNISQYGNAVKIIGYLIEKLEYTPGKRPKRHRPIILPESNINTAIDTEVKYGSVYRYNIRAIALVQFQAINESTGQSFITSGLISSRPSNSVTVRCREYNPPPPPQDINFVWDYRDKKLMIMWSFPVVRTRDVKRFQIFRRDNIQQPYMLLSEYDFDDSEIPDPRKEVPRSSRVIEMDNPATIYIDPTFNKDSKFIYTLCSIDAHDFSSNYSQQFLVYFDKISNKLVKELISPEGAPKPYPNFYLIKNQNTGIGDINLTTDLIKDSGHEKCTIFFDPEYLSIIDEQDHELNLLSMADKDKEGRYKMQVINVDRQKSQVVSIDIRDLRKKK